MLASGLQQDARADQTPFVERPVAPAYIKDRAVEGRLALGREMRDIGAPIEQFGNQPVTAVRRGRVNHAAAISMTRIQQFGLTVQDVERGLLPPLPDGFEQRVVFFGDGNILAGGQLAFFVFRPDHVDDFVQGRVPAPS